MEAISGSASAFALVKNRLDGKAATNKGLCATKMIVLTSDDVGSVTALKAELTAFLQSLFRAELGA